MFFENSAATFAGILATDYLLSKEHGGGQANR